MFIAYSKALTLQDAAAATGNGTVFDISDLANVALQVSGTFVGTVTFEATVDGTNWVAVLMTKVDDASTSTTATAAGLYHLARPGLRQVRARVSAYTSGSITVKGFATAAG